MAVARLNGADGFVGLLITPNSDVVIKTREELGQEVTIVMYNGREYKMSGEYELEEVIQIIEEATP